MYDKVYNTLSQGFHAGMVFENSESEMSKGDIVLGGFISGRQDLILSSQGLPYTYRLLCENGMISAAQKGNMVRATKEDMELPYNEWVERIQFLSAYGNLSDEFALMKKLKDQQVDDHAMQFTRQLFRDLPVPKNGKGKDN